MGASHSVKKSARLFPVGGGRGNGKDTCKNVEKKMHKSTSLKIMVVACQAGRQGNDDRQHELDQFFYLLRKHLFSFGNKCLKASPGSSVLW